MVCMYCGNSTSVINSRRYNSRVWRRRKCYSCNAIFTTEEIPNYSNSLVVTNKDGKFVPFSQEKLFLSVNSSCQHRSTSLNDALDLTTTITNKLLLKAKQGVLQMSDLLNSAHETLEKFDYIAGIYYKAYYIDK